MHQTFQNFRLSEPPYSITTYLTRLMESQRYRPQHFWHPQFFPTCYFNPYRLSVRKHSSHSRCNVRLERSHTGKRRERNHMCIWENWTQCVGLCMDSPVSSVNKTKLFCPSLSSIFSFKCSFGSILFCHFWLHNNQHLKGRRLNIGARQGFDLSREIHLTTCIYIFCYLNVQYFNLCVTQSPWVQWLRLSRLSSISAADKLFLYIRLQNKPAYFKKKSLYLSLN